MTICGCGVTKGSEADTGQVGSIGNSNVGSDKNVHVTQKDIADLKEGEKYQITLGWNENLVTQLMDAAIVEFNKTNPYYEVVIQHYDWQNGQQQLEMELGMGKGPDLFDMSMVYGDKLAEKRLIEDLSIYLEDGQGLEREDVVESVLRCNTVDEVLTCIPARFTVGAIVGKSSRIGEKSSWTAAEFLACVEANEGMQIANSNYRFWNEETDNQYSIIETVLQAGIEYFIDKENNRAAFDKEEFKNLLKLAKEYQADNFDYNTQKELCLQVKDDELLLNSSGIASVGDYMLSRSILGKETQYIGFPTYEGDSTYGICNYVACGMNSNSQVKDGAWAFIEFLVQYRFEEDRLEHGFFTENSGLKAQFEDAMEKEYTKVPEGMEPIELPKWNIGYSNGETIAEAYAATQEDIDYLKALIDGADFVYDSGSNSVYLIVQEEVFAYLESDRSLEETIQVIQNRVQLFLDEMR